MFLFYLAVKFVAGSRSIKLAYSCGYKFFRKTLIL